VTDEKHTETGSSESAIEESITSEQPSPLGNDASPEAIARRVAALGDEDPLEAQAREEERKLLERRRAAKAAGPSAGDVPRAGGAKKSGLELAASKRVARVGTKVTRDAGGAPRGAGSVAAAADPLLEKTAKVGEWISRNQRGVQLVGLALIAGALAVGARVVFERKDNGAASLAFASAVEDERTAVFDRSAMGAPGDEDPTGRAMPHFKTYDERRDSALKKYREVYTRWPKTGPAALARLAEGSLLLEQRNAEAAGQAFAAAKASALASADKEVRGRAIEGLGFAAELKARTEPASAAASLDQAIAVYKELEDTIDAQGFKELAQYHQARVLLAKGDKAKAKELLTSLKDRVNKTDDAPSSKGSRGVQFLYLRDRVAAQLKDLDPPASPSDSTSSPTQGSSNTKGGSALDPDQLRKLVEQMQKNQGGADAPHKD